MDIPLQIKHFLKANFKCFLIKNKSEKEVIRRHCLNIKLKPRFKETATLSTTYKGSQLIVLEDQNASEIAHNILPTNTTYSLIIFQMKEMAFKCENKF